MNEILVYGHPALAIVACVGVVWVGFGGLRSRRKRPDAAASRVSHRAWAPRVWALVGLAALGGPASVILLREDLEVTDSVHFWVGLGIAGLMTAGWATSRSPRAKAALWAAHPWIGMASMLGAIFALILGLEMLP